MARKVQEPSCNAQGDSMGGDLYEHPAYAQIGASRVSGGAILYGSDFRHQYYITIRIAKSALRRSLSNDWPLATGLPYIEVSLSEAQWATFISTLNVGSGVQCTLDYLGGNEIPGIPNPVRRQEQFANEMDRNNSEAHARIDELRRLVQESGLSAKKRDDILRKIDGVKGSFGGNTKFIAEQFGEHMEKVAQSAKVEINAYALHMMRGLNSNIEIGGSNEPLVIIEAKRDGASV